MWYYIYGGIFILGVVLLSIALWQYQQTKKLLLTGIKTKATVIQLIAVEDTDDGGYTYKPVFQYTRRGDGLHTYTSAVSSNPATYKVGEKTMLVYDPLEKDDVKIMSFWGLYNWTIVLLCLAAPLLIIGGGYLLYLRG